MHSDTPSLVGPDVRLDSARKSDATELWPLIDCVLWQGMNVPCPASVEEHAELLRHLARTPGLILFRFETFEPGVRVA